MNVRGRNTTRTMYRLRNPAASACTLKLTFTEETLCLALYNATVRRKSWNAQVQRKSCVVHSEEGGVHTKAHLLGIGRVSPPASGGGREERETRLVD